MSFGRWGKMLAATFLAGLVAGSANAEPKEMKMSSFLPPTHILTGLLQGFAKELSAASNGEVEIEYFGAEALGKAVEQYDLTLEGLADFGLVCTTYTPSRFPLTAILELPFASDSAKTSMQVFAALAAGDILSQEYKEVHLLLPTLPSPNQIFANKPIQKADDLAGLRMFGFGPHTAATWAALGAQSVSMGFPDAYLALDRGTLDGVVASWAASTGWKWQEVVNYPVDVALLGGFTCGVMMNLDSWNSLSTETRAAWTEIAAQWSDKIAAAYDANDETAKRAWEAAGKKIFTFPAEDRVAMAEKLKPVWEAWVADMKAKGLPGDDLYREYAKAMEAMGKPLLVKLPELLN